MVSSEPDECSYSQPVGNPGHLGTIPAEVRYMTKYRRNVAWTVAEGGTGIASSAGGIIGALWPVLSHSKADDLALISDIALTAANFAIQKGAPQDESEKDEDFTYLRYCEALDKQLEKRAALASTDPVVRDNASQWPEFFPDFYLVAARLSRDAARPAPEPGQPLVEKPPVQENDTYFTNMRSTMFGNFVWQTTKNTDRWQRDYYTSEGYVRTKDDTITQDKGNDLKPMVTF